jgi:mono/diheme cytochrome c family protein
MKRLELILLCSSALALPLGCSSSTTAPPVDAKTQDAPVVSPDGGTIDAPAADAPTADGPAAGDGPTAGDGPAASDAGQFPAGSAEARGQYLVTLLGCGNCHSPKVAGTSMVDTTKLLSGIDCFVTGAGVCLSSANLTNDESGIKGLTDDQVIAALRDGVFESAADAGNTYLFDRMPYYQFNNLTDTDAKDIVAYLRAIPPVAHKVSAAMGMYATRPTAPEDLPVKVAELPIASTVNASTDNGKYLAALNCLNCHTLPLTADGGAVMPKKRDPSKAFQGGVSQTANLGDAGMKMFTSANLTPATNGLMGLTPDQIATEIKTGKNQKGQMLCAPMRAFPALTDADAKDIATYLLAIPPVMGPPTTTCN